jgi:hypothetical protein
MPRSQKQLVLATQAICSQAPGMVGIFLASVKPASRPTGGLSVSGEPFTVWPIAKGSFPCAG